MNRFLLTFLAIFCAQFLHAQSWQWAKRMTTVPANDYGVESFLIATDQYGNMYSSATNTHIGSGIVNLAGTELHLGSLSLTDSFNKEQSFLTKIDRNGNFQWLVGTQRAIISDIAYDAHGYVYFIGSYDSFYCTVGHQPLSYSSLPVYEYTMSFLAKATSSGGVLWARNLAVGEDAGFVRTDAAGNVYLGGSFSQPSITIGTTVLNNVNPSLSSHTPDIFFAAYDSLGTPLWAKRFGSAITEGLTSMSVSAAGNVYASGTMQGMNYFLVGADTVHGATTPTGVSSFWMKLGNTGTPEWARYADTFVAVRNILLDPNESLYLLGCFTEDSVNFGGHYLLNHPGHKEDIMLVKYDSAGHAAWARSAGGDSSESGFCLTEDKCGHIWLTAGGDIFPSGYRYSFGADTFSAPLTGTYVGDYLMIADYDTSGTCLQSFSLSGGGDDQCGIACDNFGSFYLSGDWEGNGPSTVFGSDTLPLGTLEYYFVAKYFYDTAHCLPSIISLGTEETRDPAIGVLFPNPASDICYVDCAGAAIPAARVEVADLAGRLLTAVNFMDNKAAFGVANMPPGMYLCRIVFQDGSWEVRKMVVGR